jgi:hypothetical protein
MALQKAKILANGTEGNYWKVTHVSADKIRLELTVHVSLYLSKQAADEGKSNMGVHHTIKGSFTKQQLAGDLTALGYQLVKQSVSGAEPTSPTEGLKIMAHRDLTGSIDV